MGRGKTKTMICGNCGGNFEALLIKIRIGKGKFCSRRCYNEFRNGNKQNPKQLAIYHQKKHKYGLSKEDYLGMFTTQKNSCAICKVNFNDVKAFVDHNHVTGKVRGLLCSNCNSILGMANDNAITLQNAVQYLNITSGS